MRWPVSCFYAVLVATIAMNSLAHAQLVGHWKFDDGSGSTLGDSSGNSLNGTLSGSPVWAPGHTGTTGDYSLQFNGSNYVSLGNPADLAIIGDQTISMWLYPTDASVRRNPYAKAYAGSGTLTLNVSASSTSSLTYYYGNYGDNNGMGNPNPALGQKGYEQWGVSPLTLNAWNHVVVTRSLKPTPGTGLIATYINGVRTGANTPVLTSPDGPYPLAADNLTAYFARGYVSNYIGNIDDAQIYNVALSAEEVKWLYQNSRQSVPTWDGSVGTWATAGSWSTGVVPNLSTGSDSARIDSGEVTYVPGADFTINNGNSLNLSGTGTWKQTAANPIRIGDTSNGTVNQAGGTFDAAAVDNVVLGAAAGAAGTYNLDGGTLRVKAIGQGAGTANFNFDGGTLQAAAGFTTSLPMTIKGNGATIDTNGNNVTLSGNMAAGTGSGGLTKTGNGTLRLDGLLSYTGGTTVAGGTVMLNRAGALVGGNTGQFASSGRTITVNDGATLQLTSSWAMGDGQQHQLVANGGTLEFLVSDNYQSKITLTGGHITTRNSGYPWRTGNYGNGLITVNASDSSSTIEGLLCFVKTGAATKTTFDVADGVATDDLVVSAVIFDHDPPGTYGGMVLVKDGPGKMVLSGTNAFIGNVEVAQGVIQATSLGNKGVAGNLGAGTTIILGSSGHNGTLKLSTGGVRQPNRDFVLAAGGSGTFEVSDYMDLSGIFSGDGDFHKKGINESGNGGSRLSFGRVNTYTGDTYIDEGVLQVSGEGTIPDTSDVYITGGAAGGRLRLNHAEAINGLFGDGVVQTFSGYAQTLTIGAAGGDGNFSGVLEPGITLVKSGAGTQILSGVSTFTGSATVADGVLVATSLGNKGVAGNLGAGTTIILGSDGHNGTLKLSTGGVRQPNRDFVLAAGGSGTFEVSDFIDLPGIISGDGDFYKKGRNDAGNGGTRLSLGGVNTYTGDTYILEGVVQTACSGSGGAIPDTSNVHIAGGAGNGRLRLVYYDEAINGLFGDGTVQTYSAQSRTLTVGAANGDGDFSGVLEPGIALVKAGTGTQVLRGSSTYAGGTSINAGTLLVNNTAGSGTGTGAVAVNSAGTLGGTGRISGAVRLAGAISPGASVGTLSTGSQTWLDGGHFTFEIDNATGVAGRDGLSGGGWDLLAINGGLDLSGLGEGGFEIDLASLLPGGGTTPGPADNFSAGVYTSYAWDFVRTTGTIDGFAASKFHFDASGFLNPFANQFGNGRFAVVELGGNTLAITFTAAVPEPSTAVLFALGPLGLALTGVLRKRLRKLPKRSVSSTISSPSWPPTCASLRPE
jgi:autotransporter-associated beta strand protein